MIRLIPETNKFHTAVIGYARSSNLHSDWAKTKHWVADFFFQLKPFIFRMIYDDLDNIRFREMKHV